MKNAFWEKFLAETGRDENTKFTWSMTFGMDREAADSAVEKVLLGEKTAMIYPENGYRLNMSAPSKPGDLHIICDWRQQPRAVVEVISVEKLALSKLTDEHCAREADAKDLDSWKSLRLPIVKTEIEELGGELADDTALIFESFRLVYPGA